MISRVTRPIFALVLACTIAMSGCNTSWLTTFDRYAAQIAPAAQAVIAIVSLFGAAVPPGLGAKINADSAAVTKLVGDFANAAATAQPGIQSQIAAQEAVLNQDLATLYNVAQVSDKNTQAKVTNLITLCESLVQAAFAALPPSTSTQAVMAKAGPIANAQAVASGFSKNFNAVLTAKTGNGAVDALTPKLKLPEHGRLVHFLTFDLVK